MAGEDGGVIRKRLDVLIGLLLQVVERGGRNLTAREQIDTLAHLGLRPIEIAAILGKKDSYVSKELAVLRRKSRK